MLRGFEEGKVTFGCMNLENFAEVAGFRITVEGWLRAQQAARGKERCRGTGDSSGKPHSTARVPCLVAAPAL